MDKSASKHDKKDKKSHKSSKKKKEKKSKSKKHKKQKERKVSRESTDSSSSSETGNEVKLENAPSARDNWMSEAFDLKTFSKAPVAKKAAQPAYKPYDPATSSRELNPHWKTTGTGLPAFQKPREDDDFAQQQNRSKTYNTSAPRAWKRPAEGEQTPTSTSQPKRPEVEESLSLNELNAKILKAELVGNTELLEQLKEKLEKVKANPPTKLKSEPQHIVLTHTDKDGNCRPLRRDRETPRTKNRRIETHINGERVRYFGDDDKYDLKQMFEEEKYTSSADANLQFANMSKNIGKDGEDIEMGHMPREGQRSQRSEFGQAIQNDKRLDYCESCFESSKFDKKLLVSYGSHFYLSLPWHVGLQPGQCLLKPVQHASASTLLDENSWAELSAFRQALCNMFAAQGKEALFFEIAKNLPARKHMSVHCIPIAKDDSENAPFYFKKAIEESEQEWNVNKQLVTLRQKNLRQSIPKGLPYFWIHFGMDYGFAHVIEDERRFPNNFAEEIIGGMLEMNANRWRRPSREDNIVGKVKTFGGFWKKYDTLSNEKN